MQIDWIEPGILAVSSIPKNADEIRFLYAQGIRAVVSLTEYPLTAENEIGSKIFDELDIVYEQDVNAAVFFAELLCGVAANRVDEVVGELL